jgi:threonine synthase
MMTIVRCERCGAVSGLFDNRMDCAACGALLVVEPAPPDERGEALCARFDARLTSSPALTADAMHRSGVWRFRELVFPDIASDRIVSQPEGNTPLLARPRVAKWCGVDGLVMKHEGHNPTGSFKDRGMTVALTHARAAGARAAACASTGNTSSSLAAYAALAGIPALVLVPAGQVALGKLAQTIAYGARTLLVRGDFDACLSLVRAAAEELGVYLANSINPWRIAGQKTIVLEMLQQLGWEAPDWIVVPAGNLGNTAAFGAALRDALELGLIDRMPRIAAVQAAGSAPFAASFRSGFTERIAIRAETVATAIRIGDPASYDRAVRSIRESDGVVTSVSDEEILEAKATVDASGVGCEPASAASIAGVRQLAASGVIDRGARVVAVLTGHILKDPGILIEYHANRDERPPGANPPLEIDAELSAVERAIRSMEANA